MAGINDITALTNSMIPRRLHHEQRLCVTSKNRFSTCRRCIDVCPAEALQFVGKSFFIDKEACVNCGACTTVCPSQALAFVDPSDDEIAAAAVSAVQAAEGSACIICARTAAHREHDENKVVVLPCLARVDEALLLGLIAHGVTDVTLVDGECSTCKYHVCGEVAHDTVTHVNSMLEAMGNPTRVNLSTNELPEAIQSPFDDAALGNERRALLFRTKDQATGVAKNFAVQAVRETTGINISAARGLEMPLRHPEVQRHDAILNALDVLGEPQDREFFTRRFGSLEVDYDACNGCMKCTYACPAHALVRSTVLTSGPNETLVEFTASQCIRCGICMDVCNPHCITLRETVNAAELFDFEPFVLSMGPQPLFNHSTLF